MTYSGQYFEDAIAHLQDLDLGEMGTDDDLRPLGEAVRARLTKVFRDKLTPAPVGS